jgi:DNA-binding MarR family transcriptional regulator
MLAKMKRKVPMPKSIKNLPSKDMTPTEQKLLLFIERHSLKTFSFPSIDECARALNTGDRWVRAILQKLEASGHVIRNGYDRRLAKPPSRQ